MNSITKSFIPKDDVLENVNSNTVDIEENNAFNAR
jgi:hypothetical protein